MPPFYRTCTVLGLVAAAAVTVVWTLFEPEFPSGFAARLAAIEEGGPAAQVSAASFAASQLPMLAAVLGLGHVVRAGSPRLASVGSLLAVVGVMGHAVFAGVALVSVEMAADVANREVHAELLAAVEGSPAIVPFAAAGLLGTVLGLLLLSVALFRTRVAPRWVPALLWLFLVLEFVGSNLSDLAGLASVACFVVAFVALAITVQRTPREVWETPAAVQPRARLAAWSSPATS